jgi:hypothetical protein
MGMMVFFDKLNNMTVDLVASMAHRHGRIKAFRFQRSRAFNRPFLTPDSTGENRARPLFLPIAKRDYIMKSFAEVWINYLRPRRGDVDPDLSHRRHCVRVQATRFCSCAHNLEFVAGQIAKKRLSHLSTAGVLGAKKQNPQFDRHGFSYLQI